MQAVNAFKTFENNNVLFDPRLMRMMVACKQQEQVVFGKQISKLEYETYVETV